MVREGKRCVQFRGTSKHRTWLVIYLHSLLDLLALGRATCLCPVGAGPPFCVPLHPLTYTHKRTRPFSHSLSFSLHSSWPLSTHLAVFFFSLALVAFPLWTFFAPNRPL